MPRKRPLVSVEIPEELVAPLRAILDHLSEFQVAAGSGKADFGAAEARLGSLVARLECDGVATLLTALDPRCERVEVDGKTYRRMNIDGQEIYKALPSADTGRGLLAGLGIAFIGIIASRFMGAWAKERKRALGMPAI